MDASTATLAADAVITASQQIQAAGLIDWVSDKSADAAAAIKVFAALAAIIFVIIQAFMSRGNISRIIVSGLAAGAFYFITTNITTLAGKVEEEVDSRGTEVHQLVVPPSGLTEV